VREQSTLCDGRGVLLADKVLRGARIAAISALADNANFHRTLRDCGARIVQSLQRRDHHFWREKEVCSFAREAHRNGASAIVTTEKDAVKIAPAWAFPLPLWSLAIELKISLARPSPARRDF
jgi:tetraacyldisaccharide 4'-kinase